MDALSIARLQEIAVRVGRVNVAVKLAMPQVFVAVLPPGRRRLGCASADIWNVLAWV
jgi:hypothetical protein